MNKKSLIAIFFVVGISFGMIYSSKAAYAHTFGGNESSEYLAKVKEVPVVTHSILNALGNKDLLAWNFDKISEYWNDNDTKEKIGRAHV